MRKIFNISLFVLLLSTTSKMFAQDEENPIFAEVGINAVDLLPPTNDKIKAIARDYLGPNDWRFGGVPIHAAAGFYLFKGLSINASVNLNKVKCEICERLGNKESKRTYFNTNFDVRFALNQFVKKQKRGWFDPYIKVGIGVARLGADEEVISVLSPGGGVNLWLSKRWGIALSSTARYSLNKDGLKFNDKGRWFFQHNLGIIYKFNVFSDKDKDGIIDKEDKCPQKAGPKRTNGCPDQDNDGIPDKDDACPKLAGKKALKGCPDSDNDGVNDKEDQCPEEAGSKELNGCPDSDNDGVIDIEDACPDEKGTIENFGCPNKEEITKKIIDSYKGADSIFAPRNQLILFDLGKSNLKPTTKKYLDKLAEWMMSKHKDKRFYVKGNTDNMGGDYMNIPLSIKRSQVVIDYLASKGVDYNMLIEKGYAADRPLNENKTDAERQENRRVEVVFEQVVSEEDKSYTTKAHMIFKGERLEDIANMHGISVDDLIKYNGLKSNDIKNRTWIYLAPIKKSSLSLKEGRHRVKRDETLYSLARKYKTSVAKLRRLNKLKSNKIKIGQVLRVK